MKSFISEGFDRSLLNHSCQTNYKGSLHLSKVRHQLLDTQLNSKKLGREFSSAAAVDSGFGSQAKSFTMDGHLTGVKKTPLGIGPSNGRGGSTRFVSHEEDAEEEED